MMEKRLNSGQKLIRQRKIMMNAQKIKATLDAAEKKWAELILEAKELGVNIDNRGIVTPVDIHAKDAWEVINFRKLSRKLSKGDLNITRDYIPKKNATEVLLIVKSVEDSFVNIFKRRYTKNMRNREYDQIKETMKKKNIRKKVRIGIIDKAEKELNSYRENQ